MIGNIIMGFVASFFLAIMLPSSVMNGEYGGFIFVGLLVGTTVLTYFIFPDEDEDETPKMRMYSDGKTVTTVAVYPDGTEQILSQSSTADAKMIEKYNALHKKQ